MNDAAAVPARPDLPGKPRQASRSLESAWVGGVCAGLSQHLGWPVFLLRLGLVLLGAVQFFGVVLYLVLWLLLPQAAERKAVGIEAATRTGHRPEHVAPGHGADVGAMLALGTLGIGLLTFATVMGWGMGWQLIFAGCLATVGIGLVWWQADRIEAGPVDRQGGKPRWMVRVREGGWVAWVVVLGGVTLLGLAGWWLIVFASVPPSTQTVWSVAVVVVILLLLAAPFLSRLRFALATAREAKLIADTQADIAAHLHDSVLQTLALIQRQADDPQTVAYLARKQERELRTWLYGEIDRTDSLVTALKAAAAEVEDGFGATVEVVAVGDAQLSEQLDALVAAAREAILNAAKHSGKAEVDVYAEVSEGTVEVFVRDRGVGFVVSEVPADRQGVRRSILERMERHGGKAVVRSTPGEGTEVRLEMRTDD